MYENRKITSIDDPENAQRSTEIPLEPCKAICNNCSREVTTFIKQEYNFYLFLVGMLIFFVFGFFYGVLISLIFLPLCQNTIHSCPYCLDVLFVKVFSPIKLDGKHVSLQYGKCIILFKQIHLTVFLGFLFVFGLYLNIVYYLSEKPVDISNNYNEIRKKTESIIGQYYEANSALTWENLIKECGAAITIDNSARANEVFLRKYYKKTIEWEGYFLNAFAQNLNPFDYNPDHLININVRMIPSESLDNPDVFLSLDSARYNIYQPFIKSLRTGDPIKFKASFETLGNEWRPHHLHLLHIERTKDIIGKDEKKVLFQGINFNITGHLKLEEDISNFIEKSKDIKDENENENNKE